MIRGTSMAIALLNAANNTQDRLGIEHHIKWRLNETPTGLVREPDVFIKSEHYTGVYVPASKRKAKVQQAAA